MTPKDGPRLSVIVLRTPDLERARAFYAAVGLDLRREQHGKGPVHYAAVLGETVLELYPAKETPGQEPWLRLTFTVPDLARALDALTATAAKILRPAAQTGRGLAALVADPDGRHVEITQDGA